MLFKDVWPSLVGYQGAREHVKDAQREKGWQYYREVFSVFHFLKQVGGLGGLGWGCDNGLHGAGGSYGRKQQE